MPPNTQKGADAKKAAAIRIAKQNARINAEQAAQPVALNPNFENKPSGKATAIPVPPRIKSWDEPDLKDPAELFQVIKKAIHEGKITLSEIIENEQCQEATIERETRRLVLILNKKDQPITLKIKDPEIFRQACSVMGVTDIEHLPTEPESFMETPTPPELSGEEAFLALDEDPTPEGEDIYQQERSVAKELLEKEIQPIQGKSQLEVLVEEINQRLNGIEAKIAILTGQIEELKPVRMEEIETVPIEIIQPNPTDLNEMARTMVKESDGKINKKELFSQLTEKFTDGHFVIETAIKKAFYLYKKDKL